MPNRSKAEWESDKRRSLRTGWVNHGPPLSAVLEAAEPRLLFSMDLVADVNPVPGYSGPSTFATVGNLNFFTADDSVHGRELWRTDGTADGTRMVKDVFPGPNESGISQIAGANTQVFFTSLNRQLWRSDGTDAGTVPLNTGGTLGVVGTVGDNLLFVQQDSTHGAELWITDGTDAGTHLLKDIRPGTAGSSIDTGVAVPGRAFFYADDGVHGSELWTSDGTEAGTRLVIDAVAGATGSGPGLLHAVGNKVFSQAGVVSDGTPEGTVLMPLGPFNNQILDLGGRAIWSDGQYLFSSDGTKAGSSAYFNINSVETAQLRPFASAGGLVYFWAQTTASPELWKTDGTAAGTARVAPPSVFSGTFNVEKHANIAGVGNELFFFVERQGTGVELWRTDGTDAGTRLVQVVNTGYADTETIGRIGGVTLFDGYDPTHGRELWKTDGTPDGTSLVRDINVATADSNPSEPTRVGSGNKVVFAATRLDTGAEVWVTDLTGGGAQLLADIRPGTNPSSPKGFVRFGDDVYFFAATAASSSDLALYKTDGTPQGTSVVSVVGSNDYVFVPRSLVMGNKLYFFVRKGSATRLWSTDGTQAGTVLIREFTSSFEPYPTVVGSRIYFAAGDGSDTELWSSDGTAAGTARVLDIRPGTIGSTPRYLTAVGGTLYFTANNGTTGTELWKSDGTPAGTALVKDIVPGSGDSWPGGLYAYEGILYFAAADALGNAALWRSDGTAAGTYLLENGWANGLQGIGGQLFYIGPANEPYVTDGVPGHARLIKDINGTDAWSIFSNVRLTAFGGAVYFVADDGTHGLEVWRSDGTASGTLMVRDLVPGDGGAYDKPLAVIGDRLYLLASDGVTGRELWTISDDVAPRATSLSWASDTSLRARFTEDLGTSLTADDLTVRSTDGADLHPSSVTFDPDTQTATFLFNSPLPNGDYTASLAAGAIADLASNASGEAFSKDFFVLAGDANRDRSVDFNDLVKLAQNYNTSGGKTYTDGDFTGDGNVDFNDLVILAQNYNTSLPGASLLIPAASFSSDVAAAFAAAAPKPAPLPATQRPSAAKPKPAPTVHPPVTKSAAPVRAAPPASRTTSPVRVTPPVFGNRPIKPRRDVQALFV